MLPGAVGDRFEAGACLGDLGGQGGGCLSLSTTESVFLDQRPQFGVSVEVAREIPVAATMNDRNRPRRAWSRRVSTRQREPRLRPDPAWSGGGIPVRHLPSRSQTGGLMNLLVDFPLGTWLVVRSRIEGGVIDALGYLREIDDTQCVIETRCGLVTALLSEVVAVKKVSPPMRSRAFD